MHVRRWSIDCSLALILASAHLRAQRADLTDRVGEWVHELTTTFEMDESLGAYVPATMQEGFTLRDAAGVQGTAYYSRFRRFTVRTSEAIDVPKP